MNYELDINKTVERLEEQIILKQRNIEVMNINLQDKRNNDVELSHVLKIAEIGAIEAMKKERDKLLKMREVKCKENIETNFLLGMLIKFFEDESKLSKTDIKVYFNMYIYSDKYDYFKFDKYFEIQHLIRVDKHQFSKSIKKLVNAECVVKNDNDFYLVGQPPF